MSVIDLVLVNETDKILILGNGGVKNSRTYNEDDTLRGYVITLQNFEKWLKEGQRKGLVTISEKTIDIKDEKPEEDGQSKTSKPTTK